MSTKLDALLKCHLFEGFPSQGLIEAAGIARAREFKKGHVIYRKGISPKTLAVIETGSVRINAVNSAGKEMTLKICSAGNWFGEAVFFPESGRPYGAVAHEQTRLLEFSATEFNVLLSNYPQCYPSIVQQLGERFEAAVMVIEDDVLRSIPARLARRLLFSADFRTSHSKDSASICLTQEQLGSMLGISRQAAYRAIQKLKSEGLVDFSYGSITINNKARLEAFIARG